MKPEDAIADYRQRLKTFEDTFEPLGSHPDESNWYDSSFFVEKNNQFEISY